MNSNIHPESEIAKNVKISSFCTIEKDVKIGEGTWIGPNVSICNGAREWLLIVLIQCLMKIIFLIRKLFLSQNNNFIFYTNKLFLLLVNNILFLN